ncbi:MAG: alpha/beta hydrolase fold domain-containing protein [Alphaproteobacteria bacterium]|nr:alpha/beta hydrolase fold domain-containing protein [Alphaproteobacteria bacterium]
MGEAIFRDYDAEELERQFNPRAYTPNFEAIVNVGFERSAAYREAARNPRYDVAYGPGETDKLDLFLPDSPDGAPVEIYIHGGFWRSREKGDFSYLAGPIVEAGGISAIVDYALCPAVTLDEIVEQMRACVVWLYRNVAEHGGDPERLHVTGHSAGGHLAAMLLATDWAALGVPADVLKSVVPISGVFEIEPVMSTSVQEAVQLTPDIAARNSPLFLPATSRPPVAVTVGTSESEEFRRQSNAYAEALTDQGLPVDYFEMPEQNHFSILTESTAPENHLTETRLRLMSLI